MPNGTFWRHGLTKNYCKNFLQFDEYASPEDRDLALATQGYGVGNWFLYTGHSAKAREIFEQVVSGRQVAAFGFIAAEVELSSDAD